MGEFGITNCTFLENALDISSNLWLRENRKFYALSYNIEQLYGKVMRLTQFKVYYVQWLLIYFSQKTMSDTKPRINFEPTYPADKRCAQNYLIIFHSVEILLVNIV